MGKKVTRKRKYKKEEEKIERHVKETRIPVKEHGQQ